MGVTLDLPEFSNIVELNIVLYNSLDSGECYNSINNLSNKASICMLVTYYNQYHGLKLKDSKEHILNPKLIKEAKLRKNKFGTIERQKFLLKSTLVLRLSCRNFL